MEGFPYNFRKFQKEIITTMTETVTKGTHLVLESGTGTGKTICALIGTLPYALSKGKKIIYTTRTNAQQRQVIIELRAIRKKTINQDFFGMGLQGRANMCLLARHDSELESGTSEELSRYCTQKKKKTQAKRSDGCHYYQPFITDESKIDKAISWAKKTLPTAEDFIDYCEKYTICPYEANKQLVKIAAIVVVPYVYLFDRTIRNMLFDWLGVADEDAILIVDEAHNLPDYLRDSYSTYLSTYMLQSCGYEADKVGNPTLGNTTCTVSEFCTTVTEILHDLRDTYIYRVLEQGIRTTTENGDAFIPTHELESEIQTRLNLSSKQLTDSIGDLITYGEKIQEARQKQGKLPRSYIHKLGIFLDFWRNIEMHQYIKLVVDNAQGKNPRIEAYCLDAAIGAEIIQQMHASIHMSGTLEPLEEYRDSLGLPKQSTILQIYPSPFPRHHRRIFYVNNVTTRYSDISKDQTILPRLWKYIDKITNTFHRNTMVFFPSFRLMHQAQEHGCLEKLSHCLYVEEQSMSQTEIMRLVSDFKNCGDENSDTGTFFTVMGGRISEGMDFPAEQLEIAIIVGIPYPKPTARQRALQRYYDQKFGKGWEYTVNAPAARKLLQAIGRLIRNENDLGVAVILDQRAPRFKPFISDLQESKSVITDINRFFRIYKNTSCMTKQSDSSR
jgi:DNA excision repair protein ERCC-2